MKTMLFLTALAFSVSSMADGKTVFQKCISCHGPDGNLKALNVSKDITQLSIDEIVNSMKEYKAGTRNSYNMGAVMQGQMATLTESDIKAVAEYIKTK